MKPRSLFLTIRSSPLISHKGVFHYRTVHHQGNRIRWELHCTSHKCHLKLLRNWLTRSPWCVYSFGDRPGKFCVPSYITSSTENPSAMMARRTWFHAARNMRKFYYWTWDSRQLQSWWGLGYMVHLANRYIHLGDFESGHGIVIMTCTGGRNRRIYFGRARGLHPAGKDLKWSNSLGRKFRLQALCAKYGDR